MFRALSAVAVAAGLLFIAPSVEAAEPQPVYATDCSGPMMFPQNGISISQIDSYLASNYIFWRGLPYFNYKEDRNWQVNPYQVAYIGKLLLERYCSSKSQSDLARAIGLRSWLINQFAQKMEASDVVRVEYDFPNKPYADKPGWGSAFAQSEVLDFAYRLKPENSPDDEKILAAATKAFLTDISHGGLYSEFGNNGAIMWEEVAATVPSLIVNGHILAIWNLDRIIPRLNDISPTRDKLENLNQRAKQAVVEFASQAQLSDEAVVYDLRGPNKLNFRNRDTYPWRIMVIGYRYLIKQGYNLQYPLATLEAMKPAER